MIEETEEHFTDSPAWGGGDDGPRPGFLPDDPKPKLKATKEQLAISENQTREHIARVQHYMRRFAVALLERAEVHDQSKLEEPEATAFALANEGGFLKGVTYGSPEYKTRIKEYLGPALQHHYENNSHHPEYHENKTSGMDLLDLVEMFIDWKSAGERHADGCIFKSIEINAEDERFGLESQVVDILTNTAESLKAEEW